MKDSLISSVTCLALELCCFSLHQSIRSTIVVSSQTHLRSAKPGYCFYPCKCSGDSMHVIRLKKQVCCVNVQCSERAALYLIIMLQLNTKIRFFIKQMPCVLMHVFMVKGRVSHPAFIIHTGQCAYVARGGLRNQPSGPPAAQRRIRTIMRQIDYRSQPYSCELRVNVSSLSFVLFKQYHTSESVGVILLNKVNTQYLTF